MGRDVDITVPWDQYGLVVELARRLQNVSPQFGKTALQKMVYILQEAKGVPCGYEFAFYNHGPFSAQLAGDLDFVDSLGGVHVSFHPPGGYDIVPGSGALLLLERADGYLSQYRHQIDGAVAEFGGLTAKQLELRATILYVYKDFLLKEELQPPATASLVEQVHSLKPHFSRSEIIAAIEELAGKGLITGNKS